MLNIEALHTLYLTILDPESSGARGLKLRTCIGLRLNSFTYRVG